MCKASLIEPPHHLRLQNRIGNQRRPLSSPIRLDTTKHPNGVLDHVSTDKARGQIQRCPPKSNKSMYQKALMVLVISLAGCAGVTPNPNPASSTSSNELTQDQAALNTIFSNRVSITQDIIDVKSLAGSVLYQVTFQGQTRYAFDPLTTDENQIKVATQTNTPFQCTYDNTVNFTASLSYFVSLSGSLTREDKATVTFADVFSATGPSITPTISTAIQAWVKQHPTESKSAYYIHSARLSTLTTSVYHTTGVSGNLSAPVVSFGGKQNYV
jgi:hypothetical protein